MPMSKPEARSQRAAADPVSLSTRFRQVREATERLVAPLSAEDQCVQSMPDASPAKWHLAHTTWFWETFVLAAYLPGYSRFDERFGYLFNSYYEAVGERHPRPGRGLLTRPSVEEVTAYRRHVDAAMGRLFERGAPGLSPLVELGLAHEEQHQELLLMDILHLFAQSPLRPAYSRAPEGLGADPGPLRFVDFPGGLVRIGREGEGFAFDNESPSPEVLLRPYRLADRLVTNGEWLAFMEDDGYGRPDLWLSDGWALARAEAWEAPLYWFQDDGDWCEMTLLGPRPVDRHAPVAHVSLYEADAYATWAGARLSTEFEWEHAARDQQVAGNFLSRGRLMTAAAGNGAGPRQMFGDVWEWTRSAYLPYPGFVAGSGAIGEYNGKFMSGQMVLRGGACVTPAGHARATYRNFFHPHQRWMFSGVRLAKDGLSSDEAHLESDFERDVVEGLSASPKRLPSKHFYDAEGSRLFEAITELAEYYPTRTEAALLAKVAPEIAAYIPPRAALIEYGSGASTKTRLLLDAAPQVEVYMPVDISKTALAGAAEVLREAYPRLGIEPLVADFTASLTSPANLAGRPKTGFFPGSTIGNFPPAEAVAFLKRARRFLGEDGQFIVGIDLAKDPAVLVAAYDDASGVTAAFNKNLLARINRELGGDFDLATFDHQARWNAAESRMEMHLESRKGQSVEIGGKAFEFEPGETIHTENSYKFTVEGFRKLAEAAGWRMAQSWTSAEPAFAIVLLT
jgi:dimethylhistidine N-methyltransferase